MLTKNDLTQIKKVVREEVEAEGENIRSEINSEIKLAGIRTTTELREINDRLKNQEVRSARMEKDIKSLQKDVRKMRKDLTKTINFFDKEGLNLK